MPRNAKSKHSASVLRNNDRISNPETPEGSLMLDFTYYSTPMAR